jgi:hypothetical protein
VSGHNFWLTLYDAALTGVGRDGIRIQITDSSRVIHDNKPETSDANTNAAASTQPIRGGNIMIHVPKK